MMFKLRNYKDRDVFYIKTTHQVPRKREDFKAQQEILESDIRKNSAMRNADSHRNGLVLGQFRWNYIGKLKLGGARAASHPSNDYSRRKLARVDAE